MLRLAAILAAGFACLYAMLPASASELDRARTAALEYSDLGDARRAGWRKFGGPAALMGQHWYHPRRPDFVTGEVLVPERPSNLLFSEIGGRQVLVGAAYNYRLAAGEMLPEGFGGSRDVWHVHDVARFAANVTLDRPLLRWAAERFLAPEFEDADGRVRDKLAMVHVWTIPNPDGPFASHNRTLAYLRLGLPGGWADGASKDAARGLALAGPDGCDVELDAEAWIANLPRATERRLRRACAQAADYVRPRLGGKAEANAAGEAAWRGFQAVRDDALTPAQKLRIASIVEDGPGLLCR